MQFAITGSSGMIGTRIREHIVAEGHTVTRVVRSLGGVPPGERTVVWHPDEGVIEASALEGHDVVIHLAGENIAGVWTDSKKRRIRDSRVRGTTLIAETIAKLETPPSTLFSASGFSYYGDQDPAAPVTENSPPGHGFLAKVAQDWEAATKPAEDAGVRVVRMRFGLALSPRGGMLQVLLPFFRLGLGTKFGSGEQAMSWIALDEIPFALMHVLAHEEVREAVNFVAPGSVTNEEFTKALASATARPALFRVPEFVARLVPGGMGEETLLDGARVVPEKLLKSGYEFRYPTLRPALRSMLRR